MHPDILRQPDDYFGFVSVKNPHVILAKNADYKASIE
jgi:hypothetical protein